MAEQSTTLQVFYQNWKEYMDTVKGAIAPLTVEQLALRAATHERSVGEIARHIIGGRLDWFHGFMGEGGDDIADLAHWDDAEAPARSAEELVDGLDRSWQFMWERLERWSPENMQHTFPMEWRGDHYDLSRSWVVWHVLEHDLQHGGEISLTLGMHGLDAPRP